MISKIVYILLPNIIFSILTLKEKYSIKQRIKNMILFTLIGVCIIEFFRILIPTWSVYEYCGIEYVFCILIHFFCVSFIEKE